MEQDCDCEELVFEVEVKLALPVGQPFVQPIQLEDGDMSE